MTPSVPDETRDLHQELLAQLRDLVPSAFLDGELDRDALLGALGLDGDSKPAFSFTWPGIERARQCFGESWPWRRRRQPRWHKPQ